jgi:protein-disulfide isomerase
MWRPFLVAVVIATCCATNVAPAQNAPAKTQNGAPADGPAPTRDQDQLLRDAEAFIRDLYAWGPEFTLRVGPATQSVAADYYRVPFNVSYQGQSEAGEVFVSKDGKSVLRGDIFNLHGDPFTGVLDHLHTAGNPATGPADAPVTLVEFADFECPHCREFHEAFAAIKAKYPQIRLIFKDYPLVDIHPWAQTAAIAARCAYRQSPDAFWKMHDTIFNDQDNITPNTAWDQLNGFAKDQGLDADTFKTCMSSQDAANAVNANRADAIALGVLSTPTVYVNGRPAVGGDPNTVAQYIQYELDKRARK